MADTTYLDWPFLDDAHRKFARDLDAWCANGLGAARVDHHDVDASCRRLVRALGAGGWLAHTVPRSSPTDAPRLDVRTLCLARDVLARHDPLADFAFAMQGLGAGPVSLFGSNTLRARYLPRVASGELIAAFALSEPDAGSDVMRMATTATQDGDGWRLDGEKTWISNGGIADFYVVFARIPSGGERAFAAFVVDRENPGLRVAERLDVLAPHPLARLVFDGCRVGADAIVGEVGKGMRVALGTLDVFRSTVGAAALGMARRALDEAVTHVTERRMFGQRLADFQLTQARLAAMATDIDTSALLVYRAAWTRDTKSPRVTREAAMAKWHATEAAQRTIDAAVQLFGGRGVQSGSAVERLYREIRSLRIYEGTSEVQQLVIAGQILPSPAGQGRT
ncbi:MAG: acyl-CoA dehydrogenase family protein [Gemmatimonadaceae bacterium]|nr:acyl-CoA dehydrogenase family protein [Gemmatimonadaceae bacterium]